MVWVCFGYVLMHGALPMALFGGLLHSEMELGELHTYFACRLGMRAIAFQCLLFNRPFFFFFFKWRPVCGKCVLAG